MGNFVVFWIVDVSVRNSDPLLVYNFPCPSTNLVFTAGSSNNCTFNPWLETSLCPPNISRVIRNWDAYFQEPFINANPLIWWIPGLGWGVSGCQIYPTQLQQSYSNHLSTRFIWIPDNIGVWYSIGCHVTWETIQIPAIFDHKQEFFQSSFQTTIQILDNLTTRHKSTSRIPD